MTKEELQKLINDYNINKAKIEYDFAVSILDKFSDDEYEKLVTSNPEMFKKFSNKSEEEILANVKDLEVLNRFLVEYIQKNDYEKELQSSVIKISNLDDLLKLFEIIL
jgi:hypothetical protein